MDSPLKTELQGHPTPAEWRAAMGCFPTGVTVVTSWDKQDPVGSTVNAFCSVSLEPPMLLICLDRANPLLGPIQECKVFGVNILAEEDGHSLAMRFGKPAPGRFDACAVRAVEGGAPQLESSPVFIDCTLECSYEAGDHFIMIGRGVRTHHASQATPLLYHKGRFPKFQPIA